MTTFTFGWADVPAPLREIIPVHIRRLREAQVEAWNKANCAIEDGDEDMMRETIKMACLIDGHAYKAYADWQEHYGDEDWLVAHSLIVTPVLVGVKTSSPVSGD